jgi:hypothetical protein
MQDWVKTLLASSVASALVSGLVSFGTVSYKLEKELHSKQAEAGYEELSRANALYWQSERMEKEAREVNDATLLNEAQKQRRDSDAAYTVAAHKIAVFGHEKVVHALSAYYGGHTEARNPCDTTVDERKKFKADVETYRAMRMTLGVGGRVSDQQLSQVIFKCTMTP